MPYCIFSSDFPKVKRRQIINNNDINGILYQYQFVGTNLPSAADQRKRTHIKQVEKII
jgi:hypothetical protein